MKFKNEKYFFLLYLLDRKAPVKTVLLGEFCSTRNRDSSGATPNRSRK